MTLTSVRSKSYRSSRTGLLSILMRSLFHLIILSLLGGVITPDAPAQTSSAEEKMRALFGDKVVARGDGFEIKQSELDESVVTIRSSAVARGNRIPPSMNENLERDVLQRLIQIKLLLKKATDEDRAEGTALAEERAKIIRDRAKDEESYVRQLTAVGLTPERLEARLLEEGIAEKVLERTLNVTITDEQVQAFYQENPARFEQPEMVRAAHILLRTRDPQTTQEYPPEQKAAQLKKIQALLERARKGEDFATLARENSDDTGSRENGGEYTFPRGRMVPAFEAAAFSLPAGQISDVITTTFGYHIIKVYEHIPARQVPLSEVMDDVRKALKAQEIQKRMPEYIAELRKQAHVEILVDRLKPPAAE